MSGARNARRQRRPTSRRGTLLGLLASVCLLGAGLLPAAAQASFGFSSFDGSVSNQDGSPATQAGSHPFQAATSFRLNTTTDPNGTIRSDGGDVKDLNVQLPPGFVGDPGATPTCDQTTFEKGPGRCPDSTAVGQIGVILSGPFGPAETWTPVWNLARPPGEPAQFGFFAITVPVRIDASVRTGGDYGLTTSLRNVSQAAAFLGSDVVFWGVPADPAHDPFRGRCGFGTTNPGDPPPSNGSCPANTPLRPFLTNPTSCLGPQTVTISADSWSDPGVFATDSFVSHDNQGNPIGADGCSKLDFSPSFSAQPTTTSADSPMGLGVDLHLPQNDNPAGLAEADLKDAVVNLPAGVSVNPAAANGLQACSPAQIGIDNAQEPSCPDASKIGTTEIDSPLLSDPLKGAVYLAQQSNNPSGTLLAIYITAEADGVLVKLPGKVEADPATGQLRTTFANNPQLPFSDFKVNFFGGPSAPLATPETCGSFQTSTDLTPWTSPSQADATPGDSFAIDSGPNGTPCVSNTAQRPLAPGFSAGTLTNQGGSYSPFVLKVTRPDGDQNLTAIDTTLPPGLLGKLAGIPECSDSALASISQQPGTGANEQSNPACPAGSEVGSSKVGAGAGSPFYVPGRVYLSGPYKGAPLSLAIVTPALAGPLDLGSIVVRVALFVDPQSAQITARSDPIPTIIQAIPLRIRDIRISLDRPSFTVNPTSCDPESVSGTVHGSDGASAPVSSRFQAAGCAALGFAPRLSATILNGGSGIHRSDHPNLQFNLHANPGDANVRRVQVTLPPSFQIDQANLGNICSETELAQTRCAGRNTVGTARATTPLLDTPLSGPVYAVSGSGGLPRLAVILNGPPQMPIQLILRGDTTTVGNRIQNTFATVPDAPVTDFSLTLNGGPQGYLVDNTNVCQGVKGKGPRALKRARKLRRTDLTAGALIDGQNGKTADQQIPIMARCTPLKHHHKKHRHR